VNGVNIEALKGDALADFRLEYIGFVLSSVQPDPRPICTGKCYAALDPLPTQAGFQAGGTSSQVAKKTLVLTIVPGTCLHSFPGASSSGQPLPGH